MCVKQIHFLKLVHQSLLHGSQLCSLVIFSGTNLQSQNKSGLLAITGEFFCFRSKNTTLNKRQLLWLECKSLCRNGPGIESTSCCRKCLLHLCSTGLCGRVADVKVMLICRLTDTKNDNWPHSKDITSGNDHAFTIAISREGYSQVKYTL